VLLNLHARPIPFLEFTSLTIGVSAFEIFRHYQVELPAIFSHLGGCDVSSYIGDGKTYPIHFTMNRIRFSKGGYDRARVRGTWRTTLDLITLKSISGGMIAFVSCQNIPCASMYLGVWVPWQHVFLFSILSIVKWIG
jgi:hypothetical protein